MRSAASSTSPSPPASGRSAGQRSRVRRSSRARPTRRCCSCSGCEFFCSLPASVGLSQMSKELEEEFLLPSCKLHFSTDRSIIRVCSQDVDGDAAQDGKILWPIILAGSGIVFVEDDVERPVQLIFDAPMRPPDFEHAFGRQAFG